MSLQTFASLQNQKTVLLAQNSKYIAVEKELLYSLLKPEVSRIRVDARWYVKKYPDVGAAIDEGLFSSAEDHYCVAGYYENRMPYEILVDEEWYLEHYPDIREAVNKGVFSSGQHHFEINGYGEGRHPFAHFSLKQA